MIRTTTAITSRRWIRLPPTWPMKPRSQRTMRMTIMVQSMGYVFPLSLFERRIPTESRKIIKQKLHD